MASEKKKSGRKRWVLPSVMLLLNACAPQQPEPEKEPETPREIQPLQRVTATPEPGDRSRPAFDPENPDWNLRYEQLVDKYAARFTPPETGRNIQVELKSGSMQSGVLKGLSADGLVLDLGNGEITLGPDNLTEDSAAGFFASVYARKRALEQGRVEYNRWMRMQEASRPEPTSTPVRSLRELAGRKTPSPAEVTPGQTAGVPGYTSHINSVPKNEGPNGRVAQVDEYIRKHAAVPHSLRVQAWGPVQKHGNGYKVRVQYSLESAGGFGTSTEDMMFFLNARGRVIQKAPVK